MKDAIIILGGGMVKDKGRWRTTHLDEGTRLGALGDCLRVEAAHVLYESNTKLLIIASGGKGMYKNISGAPTVAEVIKKELIDLGVPSESVFKEEKSQNTWQQLIELKKIIKQKNLSHVSIVSNRYHLPRILAMIKKDSALYDMLKKEIIEAISAEEVLIKHNPEKWNQVIANAYMANEMKKRIVIEQKGVQDLKTGIYKLR